MSVRLLVRAFDRVAVSLGRRTRIWQGGGMCSLVASKVLSISMIS